MSAILSFFFVQHCTSQLGVDIKWLSYVSGIICSWSAFACMSRLIYLCWCFCAAGWGMILDFTKLCQSVEKLPE